MAKNCDIPRSFRIKYDVHCKLQNFFDKEIIIKNCYGDVHAKYKLGTYCENKYGSEFEYITFNSVTDENYSDIFDNAIGDKNILNNLFDILNIKK